MALKISMRICLTCSGIYGWGGGEEGEEMGGGGERGGGKEVEMLWDMTLPSRGLGR